MVQSSQSTCKLLQVIYYFVFLITEKHTYMHMVERCSSALGKALDIGALGRLIHEQYLKQSFLLLPRLVV